MKQILFFLAFFIITLEPLSASAELDVMAPNIGSIGSDIRNILHGPATDVLRLIEGLKSDIEAKMTQIGPKMNLSREGVQNAVQRGTGQSITDILNGGQAFMQEKLSYFNSDLFISRATEFIREALTWLIETVQKVINYF